MSESIITIKKLALFLKLNEKTTYRLVSKGVIPGFKVGGSWRFRLSEINKWIKENEDKKVG